MDSLPQDRSSEYDFEGSLRAMDHHDACQAAGLNPLEYDGFVDVTSYEEAEREAIMAEGEEFTHTVIEPPEPTIELPSLPLTNMDDGTPRDVQDMIRDVVTVAGGFPKTCDGQLFVDTGDQVIFLKKVDALFGWVQCHRPITWTNGRSLVTKGEFYQAMTQNVDHVDAIEVLPHYPPMAGHYYRSEIAPDGSGRTLEQLLNRFCPETPADRQLIKGMFATVFWGGLPGMRPVFVITSDHGRGAGKSKLAQLVAHLAGGALDVAAGKHADMEAIKTRLLSPGAATLRVCMIDNLKSHGFSWSELENFVTSDVVSGRANFRGEGRRPNTLTWLLTLNGVSLSSDMAQRAVIIKLAKATYDGSWYEDTLRFVRDNKTELIADIGAFLTSPPKPLPGNSRWASWETDIVSRLVSPGIVQDVIQQRQASCDVGSEEASIIEDAIAEKLRELRYDPDSENVRVRVDMVADWYREAMNEKNKKTAAVSRHLHQMIDERQITKLAHVRVKGKRWFRWCGGAADDPDQILTEERCRFQ